MDISPGPPARILTSDDLDEREMTHANSQQPRHAAGCAADADLGLDQPDRSGAGKVGRPTYAPDMNFRAPFVGTLHLPEKGLGEDRTPVGLADGELVATIRWYVMTSRFQILDLNNAILAEHERVRFRERRILVRTPDGRTIVDATPGVWSLRGTDVAVAGQRLAVRLQGRLPLRGIEFHGEQGLIGRITVIHPYRNAYRFDVALPVMSGLEAIALAQTMRAIDGTRRSGWSR